MSATEKSHDWTTRTQRAEDGMICTKCQETWLPSEYMPKGCTGKPKGR